ncbi:type 1 glutamine amidotransferase domain-containing protein [Prolixibacteraceae bacterium]|nr:type 1 glutamine amidotransferase domain-containing protein [Prolixibacteraceae bacterium]
MKKSLFYLILVMGIAITACNTTSRSNNDSQTSQCEDKEKKCGDCKEKCPENCKKKCNEKKILFVVTSHNDLGDTGKKTGYWLSEVTHPWSTLVDAGYTVDFVSPKGGVVSTDPGSKDMKDSINTAFLNNKEYQAKIGQTMTPKDIDPTKYAAIFYAGGHGVMWDFAGNEALNQIAASIYDNGGVVAAVCHGPAGIVNIKLEDGKYLVDGKNVSAFTNEEEAQIALDKVVPFSLEDSLKSNGAIIQKADLWQEKISVDNRLVTGQNPQSAKAVGEAVLDIIKK